MIISIRVRLSMDRRNPLRSLKFQNDIQQNVKKHWNKNVLWDKLFWWELFIVDKWLTNNHWYIQWILLIILKYGWYYEQKVNLAKVHSNLVKMQRRLIFGGFLDVNLNCSSILDYSFKWIITYNLGFILTENNNDY